jgi:hypothetical protein
LNRDDVVIADATSSIGRRRRVCKAMIYESSITRFPHASHALDVRRDGYVPGAPMLGRRVIVRSWAFRRGSWFSEGFAATLCSFSRSFSTGRMKKALSRSSAIVVSSAPESRPSS